MLGQDLVVKDGGKNDNSKLNCHNKIKSSVHLNGDIDKSSWDDFSLTQEEKNELKQMLDLWNMGFLFQTCVAECVDIKALSCINSTQISQLLSKYPLGIKIKFENVVKQWQNKSYESINVQSPPCSTELLEASTSSRGYQLSLDEILNRSTQGLLVLSYYKEHKGLNETCRNLLSDVIISSLIEQKIPMSISIAENISKTITETFTSELKETYFVRDTDSKSPKGKLYTKYYNKLRNLKNHGLVSQGPTKKSKLDKKSLTRLTAPLNDELEVEDDADQYVSLLNREELLWDDVENYWKKTSVYRLTALKKTNCLQNDLKTIWPHYLKPFGYKLIDIDFQRLHIKASDLLKEFDNTKEKLVKILSERVKDPLNKKVLTSMIENVELSENSKDAALLYLLHAIFIPTTKKSCIDSNGKKVIIKFSIQDSQNSYALVGATEDELEEMLNRKKQISGSIQPCLLIIGTIFEPKQIMVFFNNIKYKIFSVVRALDICFKIFHVFNLEYPIESLNFWLFIQKFFFNIVSVYDKPYPLIGQIISELK